MKRDTRQAFLHTGVRLKPHSPQIGQKCPVSARTLQVGDDVIICEKSGVTFSVEAWSEYASHWGDGCPYCNPSKSIVSPPGNSLATVPPALIVTRVARKWLIAIVAVFVVLIISSIGIILSNQLLLPAYQKIADITLFVIQMMLIAIATSFVPTVANHFTKHRGRVVRVATEILLFVILFIGFDIWLFNTLTLQIWIIHPIILILLLEIGSHLVEWYKISTLKRLSLTTSFRSIEDEAKAVDKIFHNEAVLYMSVPLGITMGTLTSVIRGETPFAAILFCFQLTLILASLVLLYFLFHTCFRMADPLFKTGQVKTPEFTSEQIKKKPGGFFRKIITVFRLLVPPAKPEAQNQEQKDIDLACAVSDLRKAYLYDAAHNVILLVNCVAILITLWGGTIDVKWLFSFLVGMALIFNQLPYIVGQSLLHEKILGRYEGIKRVEIAKKLKENAPLFPKSDFLTTLFTTGTAGGVLYFLLDQFVNNILK